VSRNESYCQPNILLHNCFGGGLVKSGSRRPRCLLYKLLPCRSVWIKGGADVEVR
jgi:hypothetical protein